MRSFEITPVGTVRNDRTDVQHTDHWGAVRSTITIDERFGELCLQGLAGFSHVEVLFVLDQFPEADDYREPRPYRGRSDLPPVGVFAKSQNRPLCAARTQRLFGKTMVLRNGRCTGVGSGE